MDDDDYPTIPPRRTVKGVQCGVCGTRFDHGKAYGFAFWHTKCPMQMKVE